MSAMHTTAAIAHSVTACALRNPPRYGSSSPQSDRHTSRRALPPANPSCLLPTPAYTPRYGIDEAMRTFLGVGIRVFMHLQGQDQHNNAQYGQQSGHNPRRTNQRQSRAFRRRRPDRYPPTGPTRHRSHTATMVFAVFFMSGLLIVALLFCCLRTAFALLAVHLDCFFVIAVPGCSRPETGPSPSGF